jgi:hypothetical protein
MSVPSDHVTNTWTDPADTHIELTVTVSGCEGCVVSSPGSSTPDPQLEVPPGATVTPSTAPMPGQLYYTTASPVAGYTDFGTVLVTDNATGISGFAKLDLDLPTDQSASATTILASFSLHS